MPSFSKSAYKPLTLAGLSALIYMVTKSMILLLGGEIVLVTAKDTDEYHKLDWLKDIFLTLVTASVLFVFSYYIFHLLQKRSEALALAERRATSGTLALAVIHDFNNLLTIASGSIELLESDANKLTKENKEVLDRLKLAINNLAEMSLRIKKAGNIAMQNKKQNLELNTLLCGVVKLLSSHNKLRHKTLEFYHGDSLYLWANPSMIQDAVINLVLNAADATDDLGKIRVSIKPTSDYATIAVDDDGPGIPPDRRDQVFDVFYTTKPDGSGLGLSSVKACAVSHGGNVWVEESSLGGTRIALSLVLTQPELTS